MASQRNNITLLEVQMLLQRTIMNESQSILGKLDNLGRWGAKMLLMRMLHRTSQYYIDEDEEEGENRVADQTILRQEEQEEQEQEREEDVHKEEDIQNFTDTDPFEEDFYQISLPLLLDPSLENPIVEGPLHERAEGEAVNKAIQRKRGQPSTKKKTIGIQI
ncbi:hypothetical protein HPULCUR_012045 [Helicostylum pulchrum]|uniref:Uncharacterized protein n=1 Tax=Helicostylum pulchrum TaxID=562976 RepID=A0ABP9YI29_9FUNG